MPESGVTLGPHTSSSSPSSRPAAWGRGLGSWVFLLRPLPSLTDCFGTALSYSAAGLAGLRVCTQVKSRSLTIPFLGEDGACGEWSPGSEVFGHKSCTVSESGAPQPAGRRGGSLPRGRQAAGQVPGGGRGGASPGGLPVSATPVRALRWGPPSAPCCFAAPGGWRGRGCGKCRSTRWTGAHVFVSGR